MSRSPTNSSRNSRRRLFGDRRVAGEQRALHHLGQVDQGEDRAVEVGEVPPEDVGLVRRELLGDVDGHGGERTGAARVAGVTADRRSRRGHRRARRRSSVADPAAEHVGSQPQVDDRHGHRLGPVEHGLVAARRRRRSRRTRACGSTTSGGRHRDHRVDRRARGSSRCPCRCCRRPRRRRPGSTSVPPERARRWRRTGRSAAALSSMSA